MQARTRQINNRNADNEALQFIQRLQAKDEQAFRELMDMYGNEMIRVIYLLTKDKHLAEDICQETFVTVFEKIEQYENKGSFKGWILTIAINHCRASMRKAAWKKLFYKDMRNEQISIRDHHLENTPTEQTITEHIHQLPYKYREVIVLHYYEDLSVQQMSERLGISAGTLKSRLSRARDKLKHLLQQGGWNE